jgi:disulfide bond formation protein DsbB
VLGLLALVVGWVPIVGVLLGLAALVVAIVALVRRQRKAFAIAGLVTGVIGLLVGVAVTIGSFWIVANDDSLVASIAEPTAAPSLVGADEEREPASAGADGEADLSTFGTLDESGFAALTADPGAHYGEGYVLYGEVQQFDEATGDCQLMINVDDSQQQGWEGYGEYAMAFAASSVSMTEGCPEFAGVTELAHLKIWARVLGVNTIEFDDGTADDVLTLEVSQVETLTPLP